MEKETLKLSKKETYLLLSSIDVPKSLLQKLQKEEVFLTFEDADYLRDLCGDKLQKNGFDENYLPTELGKKLENLIDILFTK
ncbi:MAG: hypothetical protein V3R64_08025 [Sphingomonadales bacterium]